MTASRVEPEKRPDHGRIVVRDEAVAMRCGDAGQCRQRCRIDRPVVVRKARRSPRVEQRELRLGFAGTCDGGLSKRHPRPAVGERGRDRGRRLASTVRMCPNWRAARSSVAAKMPNALPT